MEKENLKIRQLEGMPSISRLGHGRVPHIPVTGSWERPLKIYSYSSKNDRMLKCMGVFTRVS